MNKLEFKKEKIIKIIKNTIINGYKYNKGIVKSWLIGEVCLEYGVGKNLAKELIDNIINSGYANEDENNLIWLSEREILKIKEEEKETLRELDKLKDLKI